MDALELLRGLPDEYADLFFADPPYNLGYDYDKHDDTMPSSRYLEWCYQWIDEACRILKPTGSLFVLNIPKHAISLANHLNQSMQFQHWITWNAPSRFSNKPLMPAHYALLWYTKTDTFTRNTVRFKHPRCRKCGEMIADYGGKKHLAHEYGPVISDVWNDIGRAKHSQRKDHPCKLPEKFVTRVLKLATDPGDIVVDPFMGAGTTAFVAQRLGRHFIGCDLSLTYIERAKEDLSIPFMMPMFDDVGS